MGNKTVKMTAGKLNAETHRLRGNCQHPKKSIVRNSRALSFLDGGGFSISSTCGVCGEDMLFGRENPDYCSDIAAAMELWRELPECDLSKGSANWLGLSWFDALGVEYSYTSVVGKEAELIARAFYEWKTGQTVEIMKEKL